MRLLRKALEDHDEGNKSIVLKGPLSEVYTKALNIVYDKETTDFDDPVPNEEVVALEDNKKPLKKLKIKKGSFHEWLKKKPGEPITDADIEKGLKSDNPHVRKMAQFAKNAKKWHHKKKKVAKEEFTSISLESIKNKFIASLETQQMDVGIMSKLSSALDTSNISPTDNFITISGTSKDDLSDDDIVNVTTDLANKKDNEEYVLVIDACNPNAEGDVGEPEERTEVISSALEAMVLAYNGKVFYNLEDAGKYIFK